MTQEIPDGIVMEPVFVIEATYAPDAAETRPPHPADPPGPDRGAARGRRSSWRRAAYPDMSGSLLLVRAADADAALALAREDVYMREGVWVEARVRPFVRVARAGRGPPSPMSRRLRPPRRPPPGRSPWRSCAATVAVAGCGATTGSPAPAPPSTPTSRAVGRPGVRRPGPAVTPLPPGSFTFDLPTGWRAVPVAGNHDALLASLRAQNPAFAESLGGPARPTSRTPTSYVAFDASPERGEEGRPRDARS